MLEYQSFRMFQPGISVAGSRHQYVHLVLQMILWICQTLIEDVLGALRPWMDARRSQEGRRDDLGNLQTGAPPSGLSLVALNSHCPGMAMEIHIKREPRGA